MKKAWRKIAIALACLGLLFSGGMLFWEQYQGKQAEDLYQAAQNAVQVPANMEIQQHLPAAQVPLSNLPEEAPRQPPLAEELQFLLELDLQTLKNTNGEVVGWIYIPDSPVSYPFLQGQDNAYYLKRTWDKQWNFYGSVFMEHRSAADFSDFNTILYGHNMNDSQMFGSLTAYREQSYWQEHPCVYLVTEDRVLRYAVFASYEAALTDDTYRLVFDSDAQKEAFLRLALDKSQIKTEIVPTVEDEILTLSTCTGVTRDTRWMVQAVLTGEFSR